MNRERYDDQTYGPARDLDTQAGRLSGDMAAHPIFLRPNTREFWVLALTSAVLTLLALVAVALLLDPSPLGLGLTAAATFGAAFAATYLADALIRWRLKNYRYQYPRDLEQ